MHKVYKDIMGYTRNKKKANMARGSVDKAQNRMIKDMKKDLDELKDTIESKYNYLLQTDLIQSLDISTIAGRQKQIYSIKIGSAQGVSDQQRIGDQVTLKHIDFNYRINLQLIRGIHEFVPDQTTVRIIMFWDNQPTSVNTAGTVTTNPVYWPQLLQTISSTPGPVTNNDKQLAMLSEKDWDQRKRFSFIYDKTHTLIPSGSSKYGADSAGVTTLDSYLGARGGTGVIRVNKNYKGQKLRYSKGGTLPVNRKLYYAWLSDIPLPEGTGSPTDPVRFATNPSIQTNVRTIYDDI